MVVILHMVIIGEVDGGLNVGVRNSDWKPKVPFLVLIEFPGVHNISDWR